MLNFQTEKLDRLLADGLDELIWAHWEETETDRDAIPLAVDWDYYRGIERARGYIIVSARQDGRLVGYNAFFLNKHAKYRFTTIAVNDVMYLAPDARRGWAGVRLIREAQGILQEGGARRIIYAINENPRLAALLAALGYGKRGEVFSRLV